MLKVGIIDYLNIYPIYNHLKKCQFCEFIFNHPSTLNRLIKSGKIDISPSSSLEYLKNKDLYYLFDEFSISSRKKILSVILYSDIPIEKVDDNTNIFLSPYSTTSNALIKIIFFEFFNKFPKFSQNNNSENMISKVIIGDEALKVYFSKKRYVYDLAEIWYNFTKLPFVFGLWIGNKDSYLKKQELFKIFYKILKKAIRGYKIPLSYKDFSQEQIENYFENIDYNLNETHKKSLKLFENLAKKWKII